jgi:hypothetical protein
MSKLTDFNPAARELVTESLDKGLWWNTLKVIVQFLCAKNVEEVRVEFRAQVQVVQLSDLESFIKRSLDEGKIKWGRSDCCFYPLGAGVTFMLCNDADVHLASADSSLLSELARTISASGIKVYDSGQII